MNIIQHKDGVVVATYVARSDADNTNVAVVDSIPAFEPKEGYNGVLKYGENGLYWDYVEVETATE